MEDNLGRVPRPVSKTVRFRKGLRFDCSVFRWRLKSGAGPAAGLLLRPEAQADVGSTPTTSVMLSYFSGRLHPS